MARAWFVSLFKLSSLQRAVSIPANIIPSVWFPQQNTWKLLLLRK